MSNPLDSIYAWAVPLPIPATARQTAQRFAAEQPSVEKARQVHNNTLSVWAMHAYCQMLGIRTDLANSDSWNPTVRLMADVADLVIPGVGRLECRPVATDTKVCSVPPEVWALRVGYGVIELSEDSQTARLLGFSPTVSGETLALQDLSSPEDLIDHLYALKHPQPTMDMPNSTAHLSQWFNQKVEAGWQTIETLLASTALVPAFSFRTSGLRKASEVTETSIRRGKLVNLSVRLGSEQVVMLVNLHADEISNKIDICVQLHPVNQTYLPANLELLILESSGEVFMQAQARWADNYIQLQFIGEPGEHFTAQIKLGDIYHSEQFIV